MLEVLQSALDPAGRAAGWMSELAWAVMLGGTLVFAIVMVLAICGVVIAPRSTQPRRARPGTGLAYPVLAVTAAVVYALIIGEAFSQDAPANPLRVELTSKRGWWEVRYDSHAGEGLLANELRLPARRPVEIVLAATEGKTRFRVPQLAIDVEAQPGTPARLFVTAAERGAFAAADGSLAVIAENTAEFEEWLARQVTPGVTPTSASLKAGRAAFFRGGCDACHTIRGTAARGRRGPDLTHVATRHSFAVAFDAHVPGAVEIPEMLAIAGYLASLK